MERELSARVLHAVPGLVCVLQNGVQAGLGNMAGGGGEVATR